MLANSSKTFSAKDNIVLTSANAGSTQVIYNGKDLGKLGAKRKLFATLNLVPDRNSLTLFALTKAWDYTDDINF
jgi:hypothetical protein